MRSKLFIFSIFFVSPGVRISLVCYASYVDTYIYIYYRSFAKLDSFAASPIIVANNGKVRFSRWIVFQNFIKKNVGGGVLMWGIVWRGWTN